MSTNPMSAGDVVEVGDPAVDPRVDEPGTTEGISGTDPSLVQRLSGDQLATTAIVVAAMAIIATAGFRTIFSSASFFAQSAIGAALGALVVVIGRRYRLLFGEIMGAALLAPIVVGPIAAGGTGFYRGLVSGWAEVLSATPPVDATPELRALPFVAAFVGALAGTELGRLREWPGLAVVGPLATLAITALFSEQTRTGALAVGLVLLIGLLLIARLNYAAITQTGLLVLILVFGFVAALASTALLLPVAEESRRFDLRDLQEPPWDPLALASPLTEIKAGLKVGVDDQRGFDDAEPILRINGSTPVSRWRIAALPVFNGKFWSVADPDTPSEFVAIDTTLPPIQDAPEVDDDEQLTFDVDVLAPLGVWLPLPGIATNVDFRDATDARMSLQTGTIGLPDLLLPGNSYELTVNPWPELTDDELAEVTFVSDNRSSELELLPPVVRNLAADFSTGLDQLSGRRVIAIRDSLRLGSYDLAAPPGHSFGRIAEFLQLAQTSGSDSRVEEDLRALRGYEELYAASAAVLARLSDIPTRVAVGYVIPEEQWNGRSAEVFAKDLNSWVEVFVEGSGWVPVDVTPERTREPREVQTGIESVGVPVPDEQKPPPQPEEEGQPDVEPTPEPQPTPTPDEPEEEIAESGSLAVVAATVVLAPILAIFAGVFAIIGIKAWRRKRRRTTAAPGARIAGAWAELSDRVDEAGGHLPFQATPAEAARYAQSIEALSSPEVAARVEHLAGQVSASAFHPVPPDEESAARAWQTYDELAQALSGDARTTERLKRAADPRPLRDDAKVGAR